MVLRSIVGKILIKILNIYYKSSYQLRAHYVILHMRKIIALHFLREDSFVTAVILGKINSNRGSKWKAIIMECV